MFESRCGYFASALLAIVFTTRCKCISEETLKTVGPFYLVSKPGEVKYPWSKVLSRQISHSRVVSQSKEREDLNFRNLLNLRTFANFPRGKTSITESFF